MLLLQVLMAVDAVPMPCAMKLLWEEELARG